MNMAELSVAMMMAQNGGSEVNAEWNWIEIYNNIELIIHTSKYRHYINSVLLFDNPQNNGSDYFQWVW